MTWCQHQCFVFCVYYLATSVKFKTKHQNQLLFAPMPFQICIGLSVHVMQGIFFGSWPMGCGQKHTGLTNFPCSSTEHQTDISVMRTYSLLTDGISHSGFVFPQDFLGSLELTLREMVDWISHSGFVLPQDFLGSLELTLREMVDWISHSGFVLPQDFLGSLELTLGEMVGSPGSKVEKPLRSVLWMAELDSSTGIPVNLCTVSA